MEHTIFRSDGLSEYCIFWLQKLKNQPKNWGIFMHTGQKSALNLGHVYAHRAKVSPKSEARLCTPGRNMP
jgi:hypothetical protein